MAAPAQAPGTTAEPVRLGTLGLTALVVSAILGSGIFSLPQNMAESAGAEAILLAWSVTGVGMFALARVFQRLTMERADIRDGIYGFARTGFGDLVGFNAAWGYWMSVIIGSTGYLVLMFGALGSLPGLAFFGDGSGRVALVAGLVVLGLMHALVLRGVRAAFALNVVVTAAKLIPLLLFLLFVVRAFRPEVMSADWSGATTGTTLPAQVKATMLYTLWAFMGVECATIYTGRARSPVAVSRATILGFLLTLGLLVAVSLLSLGVMSRGELAHARNPSMAEVMTRATGPWGGVLINVGLAVSVGGALLAWILISAELISLLGRGPKPTAPAWLGRVDARGTPRNALWLTNGVTAALLILNHFSEAGYNLLIQLSSAMALVPYFLTALFALKLARVPATRGYLAWAVVACTYSLWMLYAAGPKYLVLSLLLYAPGFALFAAARREQRAPILQSRGETVAVTLLFAGAIAVLLWILAGKPGLSN